jgi:hypothetical protein
MKVFVVTAETGVEPSIYWVEACAASQVTALCLIEELRAKEEARVRQNGWNALRICKEGIDYDYEEVELVN